ncbi:MAG: MarR family transcriptional regulator [Phycisphaerales bacterium]|nr:MarR family transcriptional regulator [Phycisphaerales bacterium]MCB9854187.1 MarR family transcriptional regulator [Phycisphaerales bacterium]
MTIRIETISPKPPSTRSIDALLKATLVFSRTVEHVLETRPLEIAGEPLSRPRAQILRLLDQQGPQTATQIAFFLGVSKPAVSQFLDSLVKNRLITRRRSQTDRRGVELRLSVKGRNASRKIQAEQRHLIRSALRDDDAGSAEKYAAALESLTSALAQADKVFERYCLQCGSHADGSCVLKGGGANCLFLGSRSKRRKKK